MSKLVDLVLEKTVLSGVIKYGPDGISEVDDVISSDFFSNVSNQKLYLVLHNLIYKEKCKTIDIPTILVTANALGLKGLSDEYLLDLSKQSIDLNNLRKHAFGLKRLNLARELMNRLEEAKVELSKCSSDSKISDITGIIEDKLFGSIVSSDSEIATINLLEGAKEYLDNAKLNTKDIVGIPTGFQRYDHAIGGGLRRGTINIIGARPKTGKSYLCLNMIKNAVGAGIPTLYLDTELTHQQHQMPRMLSLLSGVDRYDIETGKFGNDTAKNQLVYEASELDLPFQYKAVGSQKLSSMMSVIRRWLVKHVGFQLDGTANTCLLVYDFIKPQNSDDTGSFNARHEKLGDMVNNLSDMLKKYQIPCLMMSQVNRLAIEKPGQGTAAGSDQLEVFCESYCILGDKTQEDFGQDGFENGSLKLTLVYTRSGPGLQKGNYINVQTDLSTSKMKEGQLFSEVTEPFE